MRLFLRLYCLFRGHDLRVRHYPEIGVLAHECRRCRYQQPVRERDRAKMYARGA